MKYFWIGLGWTCVGLGVAGAFLPLLPTTPFILLAAFSFSRGSQRLHDWIISHNAFGPMIHNWYNDRTIARRVKVYATLSIAVVFAFSWWMQVPQWALAAQAAVLCVVLAVLWSRPEPKVASMHADQNDDHGEKHQP